MYIIATSPSSQALKLHKMTRMCIYSIAFQLNWN